MSDSEVRFPVLSVKNGSRINCASPGLQSLDWAKSILYKVYFKKEMPDPLGKIFGNTTLQDFLSKPDYDYEQDQPVMI